MSIDNQPLDNQPQDDDDDFDSAFDEFAGGGGEHDAPDTDRDFEGGDMPDEDEDDAPAQQDDDPSDGMTPRERELHDQLERLRHSEASQRGRLGAYQKQINELQRQVQERQASQQTQHRGGAAEGADQEKQDVAESMGLEDWEAFKEDFPEMARAVEARLTARPETAQFEQRFAQYEPALQSIQQQAQEQHLKAQEDALAARHPDWREVVAAPAFAEWLQQQPKTYRDVAEESQDASEVSGLLDMFRAQTGGLAESRTGTPDNRRNRLAAAQSVSRRGAARQGAVDDDFDAAFDHYAAKRGNR